MVIGYSPADLPDGYILYCTGGLLNAFCIADFGYEGSFS